MEPKRRRSRTASAAVLGLLAVAALLRFAHLGAPPTDFHPARQYTGALIAHGLYLDVHGGDGRAKAVDHVDRPPILEPPILESLTVGTELVLGRETLVAPRAISILAWLIGGWLLFLLSRRFLRDPGAVAAVAVMQLLPFAVIASRSFQPDPLAVSVLVGALLLGVRWIERPSPGRLGCALAVGGASVLAKADFAPFVVLPVVALWPWARLKAQGRSRTVAVLPIGIYLTGVITPAVLWTIFGFNAHSSLSQKIGNYFVWNYVRSGEFPRGVRSELTGVFTPQVLLIAFIGLIVCEGTLRRFLAGALVAYAGYAVTFNYRVATHSYYQLPAVPFVAIAAASAVDRLTDWILKLELALVHKRVVLSALALVAMASLLGADRSPPLGAGRRYVAEAELLGRTLCHPVHSVLVAQAYGLPLQYHGEIGGTSWPSSADLRLSALQGRREAGVVERLQRLRNTGARYVIVTDFSPQLLTPELREALAPYPVVLAGEGYQVWDLQSSAPSSCDGGPS